MKISIKNMVCPRCIYVVEQIIKELSLPNADVSLGEVRFEKEISAESLINFEEKLKEFGFERLENQKKKVVEQVKTFIINEISAEDYSPLKTWSELISEKLPYNYTYISNLFSSLEGITLEQFIIQTKVERIKELLLYGELSIKEIAYKLDYSSTASLSNQFKKHTGFTPSEYKSQPFAKRKGFSDSKKLQN
ncbi:helix-turn-helix domain-containing protein [Membranihabitans maritimus]|uniref:helix-turn-helix domain-containing protein n=1 Tax=Membranihabitans maritimus TaxID=2904244 RepID=UPI001F46E3F9|nr:AraC family transcriptional regulator [Membranihabitans maritimus]